MASNFCGKCGAAVPIGGKFCANCGGLVTGETASDEIVSKVESFVPVVTPAAAIPQPAPIAAEPLGNSTVAVRREPTKRSWLIAIPVALVVIALLAWALLKGLPFGGEETSPQVAQLRVDVVEESTTRTVEPTILGETATVVELPSNARTDSGEISSEPNEPVVIPEAPAPVVTRIPEGVRTPPISPSLPPRSVEDAPAELVVVPERRRAEISGDEAVQVLDSYLAENNPYAVDLRCLSIREAGYRNAGYTLSVRDRCDGGVLGLWRIDSKTREIFRQRSNGRYQRP